MVLQRAARNPSRSSHQGSWCTGNLGLGITMFQTRGAQMLLSDPLELAESFSHTTSLLISNNKQE